MVPWVSDHRYPDRVAVDIADSGRQLTYRELDENSARLAWVLRDGGFQPGDVVALLSENAVECFEVYWAALRSGLCIVPIDCSRSPEETAYLVNDSDARALIVSSTVGGLATALRPLTPQIERRYAFGGAVDDHEEYESLLRHARGRIDDHPGGVELLYSAGVTGRPKGVKTETAGEHASAYQRQLAGALVNHCGLNRATVYFSSFPVWDAFALRAFRAVHEVGGTVVTTAARCRPHAVLHVLSDHEVSVAHLTPKLLGQLLESPQRDRKSYDVSHLSAVIHSSAPCPSSTKRAAIDSWGPIVHEFYTSAEATGLTFILADQWLDKPGSVGKPLLGAVHVCDDDGEELPCGRVGLVYFENGTNPPCYQSAPELTAAARHHREPTWTTAGDLGYLDEDGYLYLTDRMSFVIYTGGRPVYPHEVEELLAAASAVSDAAVIGTPDDRVGEQVTAIVQVEQGVAVGPDLERELIDQLSNHLDAHKVPRSIHFVDEVPRTQSGKLLKTGLRRSYAFADRSAV